MEYCKNISVNIPVNVGDTLYGVGTFYMDEITEETVNSIVINSDGVQIITGIGCYPAYYLGRVLFYDVDEAMKQLKDLKEV